MVAIQQDVSQLVDSELLSGEPWEIRAQPGALVSGSDLLIGGGNIIDSGTTGTDGMISVDLRTDIGTTEFKELYLPRLDTTFRFRVLSSDLSGWGIAERVAKFATDHPNGPPAIVTPPDTPLSASLDMLLRRVAALEAHDPQRQGTTVVANPDGPATTVLAKVSIAGVIYQVTIDIEDWLDARPSLGSLADTDRLLAYDASDSRWKQTTAAVATAINKAARLADIRRIGDRLTLAADGTLSADVQAGSGGGPLTIRDAHTRLGAWTFSSASGTNVGDGTFKVSSNEIQIALLEKNLTAHGGGADIPITGFTAGDQIEVRLASSDEVRRVYTVVADDTPSGREAIQKGYDVTLTSNQGILRNGVDYVLIHVRANVTTTGIEGADPISVGPTGLISLDQGGVQPVHLDAGEAMGFRSAIGAAGVGDIPMIPARSGAFTAADEAKLDRLRQEISEEITANYTADTTLNIPASWHTKIVDVDQGNNDITLRAFHNGSVVLPDPFYCIVRVGSSGTGTINVQGTILEGQGSYAEVFRLGTDFDVLPVPGLDVPVAASRLTGTIDQARLPAGIGPVPQDRLLTWAEERKLRLLTLVHSAPVISFPVDGTDSTASITTSASIRDAEGNVEFTPDTISLFRSVREIAFTGPATAQTLEALREVNRITFAVAGGSTYRATVKSGTPSVTGNRARIDAVLTAPALAAVAPTTGAAASVTVQFLDADEQPLFSGVLSIPASAVASGVLDLARIPFVPWTRVSGKPTHIGTLTPPGPEATRDVDYNLRVRSILNGGNHFWVEDTGGSPPARVSVLATTDVASNISSNIWTTVQSVTVTAAAGQRFALTGRYTTEGISGTIGTSDARIRRSTTDVVTLLTVTRFWNGQRSSCTIMGEDTPGAGSVTYDLQVRATTTVDIDARQLRAESV